MDTNVGWIIKDRVMQTANPPTSIHFTNSRPYASRKGVKYAKVCAIAVASASPIRIGELYLGGLKHASGMGALFGFGKYHATGFCKHVGRARKNVITWMTVFVRVWDAGKYCHTSP